MPNLGQLATAGEAILAGAPTLGQLKSGWKTSEFWLSTMTTFGSLCIAALVAAGLLASGNVYVVFLGLLLAQLPSIVHTYQRSKLKGLWGMLQAGITDYRALVGKGVAPSLEAMKPAPYSSLVNPPKVPSATPGGVPQEPDADRPRGGKGDQR